MRCRRAIADPAKPGEHIKTDRRDVINLAKQYRAVDRMCNWHWRSRV
jgi:hypothetical protein